MSGSSPTLQTSAHRMELIIIALIAVEVVIVSAVLLIQEKWLICLVSASSATGPSYGK